MSRLIPAKIRAEGAELYKSGEVRDVAISELRLVAEVGGEPVIYDLDGNADHCFCAVFAQNHRYCKHIAAVEEYLKYESAEKKEVEELQNEQELLREKSQEFHAAAQFLDTINQNLEQNQTHFFSVNVQLSDMSMPEERERKKDALAVALRIQVDGAGRAYVVRDIPAFLSALMAQEDYMIGQTYYRQLAIEQFDQGSQAFLQFLCRFQIDDSLLQGVLYRQKGRYFMLPYVLLDEFFRLLERLDDNEIKIAGTTLVSWNFLRLDAEAPLYKFTVKPGVDTIQLTISEEEHGSLYKKRLLYADGIFYKLTDAQVFLLRYLTRQMELQEDASAFEMIFSYDEKDALAQALQEFSQLGRIDAPDAFRIREFKPSFAFSAVDDESGQIKLDVQFDYGNGFEVSHFKDLETLDFSRNLRFEKKIFDLMARAGFRKSFHGTREAFIADELFRFYEILLPEFEALGSVSLDEAMEDGEISTLPEISVSTRGNLLDVSFSMPELADSELTEILKNLRQNRRYHVTKSGKLVKLDSRFDAVKEALTTFSDAKIDGHHFTTQSYRTLELSRILENVDGKSFDEKFQQLFEDLTQPQNFPYEKPERLTAELRSYQEDGVRWLSMLTHYNMGGILADDMGLGKTVQAITYLLSALTADKTALIVAPSSLLYNWQEEFEKFVSGHFDVAVVEGTKDSRDAMLAETHQVYITSYGSFLKDEALYAEKELEVLLLDEAQMVKNFNSKTNKALSRLSAAHTFALSGTPIENKLDEIWAIFNIVMPGFLPARKLFNKLQTGEILKQIAPFVLRREKEQVLTELPDKMEMVQLSELTDEQKVIYLDQLDQMQARVQSLSAAEFSSHRIEILAGITRLRQICDTPALFAENYTGSSGKLESLAVLLQQVKDSGRRPLIFSQFTRMFPFVEQLMESIGLTHYKLTGSTPSHDRIDMVRAFNAGSRDAFLISLKAGGVGLNLTSSDMVILVDLWWNPAVEEQAISRAHRMGQQKMVEVVRLITKGTIEEKIIEIQKRKKDLFTAILDNDNHPQSLTQSDINEILGLKS